jgi:hypothetical protein
MLIRTMIVAFLLSFTTVGQAQMRNVADEGALEMAELFGAPVFAWDGAEVGKVLDV